MSLENVACLPDLRCPAAHSLQQPENGGDARKGASSRAFSASHVPSRRAGLGVQKGVRIAHSGPATRSAPRNLCDKAQGRELGRSMRCVTAAQGSVGVAPGKRNKARNTTAAAQKRLAGHGAGWAGCHLCLKGQPFGSVLRQGGPCSRSPIRSSTRADTRRGGHFQPLNTAILGSRVGWV